MTERQAGEGAAEEDGRLTAATSDHLKSPWPPLCKIGMWSACLVQRCRLESGPRSTGCLHCSRRGEQAVSVKDSSRQGRARLSESVPRRMKHGLLHSSDNGRRVGWQRREGGNPTLAGVGSCRSARSSAGPTRKLRSASTSLLSLSLLRTPRSSHSAPATFTSGRPLNLRTRSTKTHSPVLT